MSSMVQKMLYICRVWCHTESGCDVVNAVGVMTHISGCDVTCVVYMFPCILDVVSYIEVALSYVQYCDDISSGCDVIYSAYDVTHRVGMMSHKSGCDIPGDVVVPKIQWVRCHAWSGCDIKNNAVCLDSMDVMSSVVQILSYLCWVWCHQHTVLWCHIYWVWCHKYSGYDVTDIVDVISYIYWLWYSIERVWWHRYSAREVRYSGYDVIYAGIEVIHKVVWCLKEWLWCHMYYIWFQTNCGGDVIQTLGLIKLIHWVWWHKYSGCDIRHSGCEARNGCVVITLCVMPYKVDMS